MKRILTFGIILLFIGASIPSAENISVKKIDLIDGKNHTPKNVLVVAAHEDDESIGSGGTIIQSVKDGDNVTLVMMTDGSPAEWGDNETYSQVRMNETIAAMTLAGLPEENIVFLGYDDLGYIFDLYVSGMVGVINNMTDLINDLQPSEIYVHAYEHGHIDHDTTHYIIVRALQRSRIVATAEIYEYIEYNPYGAGAPIPEDEDVINNTLYPVIYLNMTDEELKLKKEMITIYQSQCPEGVENCSQYLIDTYFYGPDMIRELPPYNYTRSPCINDSCRWTNESCEYHNFSEFYMITKEIDALLNLSPNTPTITGIRMGKVGEEYEYTFSTSDPTQDDVYYYIKWGDDNVEEWIGPYESGEEIVLNHTWSKWGRFTISCKAKDVLGGESEWRTLEVTMPKNKPFSFNFNLLSWFLERCPHAFQILRQQLG